jgi:hypothetical protein
MVDFGDGKPVKYGEHKSGYMPKAQYDKGVEFLTNIAKTLDTQRGQNRQGQQQQQQQQQQRQQPQADPFADVWDAPIIDGPTMKKLYQQGLGPIAQAIRGLQAENAELKKNFKGVAGHVGTLAERTSSADYSTMLDGAITGLGLQGFDPKHEAVAPLMPFLREMAQDVFDSHDPNDKNYMKEMPGIFKSRVENMVKFVRAIDKARIDTAKSQRRTFTRPGGNATPGQQRTGYKHEDGNTLARRLFSSTEQPT